MDILILVLSGILIWAHGIGMGWKLREKRAQEVMEKIVGSMEEELREQQENFIPIVIEKHNNVFYVYNKETNQFMGQGVSRKELEDILHKSFPGKRFGATEKNLIEMGFTS